MEQDFDGSLCQRLADRRVTLASYMDHRMRDFLDGVIAELDPSFDEFSRTVIGYAKDGRDLGLVMGGLKGLYGVGRFAKKRLNNEDHESGEVPALITILGDLGYAPAFKDVAHYVGSCHNHHALLALSRIDCLRASPMFYAAMRLAVDEMAEEDLEVNGLPSYEHNLLVTMDAFVCECIARRGVEATGKMLYFMGSSRPREEKFIEKVLFNHREHDIKEAEALEAAYDACR